ncbi:MAG: exosortase/archaeosortase family protein [Planctomycetota bacterium]|jgi:exosortase
MAENKSTSDLKAANSDIFVESWRNLGVHVYIKIIILGCLLFFLFHQEISGIIRRWQTDPSWSHGFLIPLFSLYFLNQHKKEILSFQPKPNYLGLFFLIFALVFYVFNAVQFQRGYFRPITFIASLGAIVLFLGGWKLVRYSWLPICFLIFAVPLPDRIYRQITIPMRQWAAAVASVLLNLVKDLEATANGVVIDVIYKGQPLKPSLDVAEACSGMRLLMAFLALGVAMAYLHYRPVWQRIILLVMTVPIAILCNIVRVTITGFIYVLLDPKYAQGIYHDLLGFGMLPLAFILYGGLAWFLSSLFVDEEGIVEDIIIHRK